LRGNIKQSVTILRSYTIWVCRTQTLIYALKSKQQNSCVPLRERMKINIKLERKYPGKFKNMHTQLHPNGQGNNKNWNPHNGVRIWFYVQKSHKTGSNGNVSAHLSAIYKRIKEQGNRE